MEEVLTVSDLRVHFYTRRGIYRALNGVELSLRKGEVLGIAGESGCGKTTLGLTVMGLLPKNASIPSGEVLLDGSDLVRLLRESSSKGFNPKANESALKRLNRELSHVRGGRISMVFQDPMTSLNPVLQIGYQIAEALIVHQPANLIRRRLARIRATEGDLSEIIRTLRAGAGEREVSEYAEARGLGGIEEQVMSIWRRNDLGEVKKEAMIRSLREDKPAFADRLILRDAGRGREDGVGRLMKVPVISRAFRSVLVKEGYRKAIELLSMLEVPNPDKVVRMYPHELSGGMRQRVVIAIALANNPEVVIMDEPTSALDVTVQAQILDLTKHLKGRFNTSFIFISHDLSVLMEVSDRIAIMYAGKVVEVARTQDVFKSPLHPYTQLLMAAVPTIEAREVKGIGGSVPDMRSPPQGCMFNPRCPFATDKCRSAEPSLVEVGDDHLVACFLYGDGEGN